LSQPKPVTILAIASYEKGHAFLRQAKKEGARVLLLTSQSLKDVNQFPRESLDDIFYMPDVNKQWNREDTLKAVSYLARTESIDRIVPLDDFDLELAAHLREHLRVPGLGESDTRFYRDKLAMRMRAAEAGLNIPPFVHILNHRKVAEYLEAVPGPWVLKPRLMAGAIGIRKINSATELWPVLEQMGDEQSYYLLEKYVPGEVYHVDSIVYQGEIRFAIASGYGRPPMDVSHQGGVFTSRILERRSAVEQKLIEKNRLVLGALGLVRGVSHTEYIIGREDGTVYFLETSARVGGAHIAELIEFATGINMWGEWARVEIAGGAEKYTPPVPRQDYAGLLVCLARQEHPDSSAYEDPEIVWRMDKKNHAGFIVKSASYRRVQELLESYAGRVVGDFLAVAPPKSRPTD